MSLLCTFFFFLDSNKDKKVGYKDKIAYKLTTKLRHETSIIYKVSAVTRPLTYVPSFTVIRQEETGSERPALGRQLMKTELNTEQISILTLRLSCPHPTSTPQPARSKDVTIVPNKSHLAGVSATLRSEPA